MNRFAFEFDGAGARLQHAEQRQRQFGAPCPQQSCNAKGFAPPHDKRDILELSGPRKSVHLQHNRIGTDIAGAHRLVEGLAGH